MNDEERGAAAPDTEPRLGRSLTDLHMRLSFAYRLMRNCTHATARSLSLGPGQPRVLSYIAVHGSCTQREIARFFCIDPSAVSRMLDSLERGGFITSAPGRDRRSKMVQLTESGRAAIEVWDGACDHVDEQMVDGFTPEERAQLDGLLDRLVANLRTELMRREGETAALPGEDYPKGGADAAAPASDEGGASHA